MPRLRIAIALVLCLVATAAASEASEPAVGAVSVAIAPAFPGPTPGPATMKKDGQSVTLSNALVTSSWKLAGTALERPHIEAPQATGKITPGPGEPFSLVLADGTSLKASQFRREGDPEVVRLEPVGEAIKAALRFGGWQATLRLVSPDGQVRVQWHLVLRDEANYVQQRLSIGGSKPLEVRQLLLDGIEAPGAKVVGTVDGSPVVAGDLFFACEHPMAKHAVENGRVTVSLDRYQPIDPERPWSVTWTTGVAPAGQMRRAFLYYLERERARPYRPLCYYISWFDIAGVGVTMNDKQCMEVIEAFGEEMVAKRGVKLDAFVFDDGWDDPTTLWQFHSGFPQGFAPLQTAAAKYGAFLGTWISPFGGYSQPKVERLKFGKAQGFETNAHGFSLAGPNYYKRFSETCARMIRDYGVDYLKFDGIGDLSKNNGPGKYAPDMEALLRLIDDLRQVRADIFFNTTAGTWASPFWLWHSDSVFRGGHDVGWHGTGTNRQRWLTYRDMVGYQIRTVRGPLYPFNSLKFQSVICAKLDSTIEKCGGQGLRIEGIPPLGRDPKDLIDDIHMAAASGTQVQEFFITPSMIVPEVWDAMAETVAWTQRNADVLVDSHGIGGDPSRGQPYGYASWSPRMGILTLRNPSEVPATFAVDLQNAFELPQGVPSRYTLSSPWRNTVFEKITLQAGTPHTFALAPFEVLVLEAQAADGSSQH